MVGRQASRSQTEPGHAVGGPTQISTADLPDGVPEDQLKGAKDHHIGHFQLAKRTIDS